MKRAVLWTAVAFLVAAGLLPVLVMLARSVWIGERLTVDYYRELLASGRAWTLFAHSGVLALSTAGLSVLVGVPLGILLGRTDLPGRYVWAFALAVPLLVPPYILAVSWAGLLGPTGPVAGLLGADASARVSTWLFGLPGCVGILYSTFMPIVALLTAVAARSVDHRLEEAGRLTGNWYAVTVGISLPLMAPTVALAGMLVMLLSLGEFTVPSYLRFDVFPVESFSQFSAFYNFGAATAAAVPLAAVAFIALAGERWFASGRANYLRPTPEARPNLIPLGRHRVWLSAAVALLVTVTVVAPLAVLLSRSLVPGAYAEALTRAGASLLRSVTYAFLGASTITVIGFFLGYLVNARALPIWRSVDALSIFLFALPSTVIGVGLIATLNHPSSSFIYATPAIIVLGYVAQYSALAARITASTLARVPPSMEEAAQIGGAGWLRRLAAIVVPLTRRGIAAAWLAAYIFCLRDTGLTMLVYPPGGETLPVRTFTLMANGSEGLIAALSVVMVIATIGPLIALTFIARWRLRPS